jgi:nucleoside-diphosphate-sugar epimerase
MLSKNKRRVFITGASGFIGANLTRTLLKNNYDVHILNRSKKVSWRLENISQDITIHIGDITDIKSLKNALQQSNPDYIIHLAVYGAYHFQTEMDKIIQINITGTKNLLEASKAIPYKCFINTGSSSEYGYKNILMKETDFCDPISYYAATKLAATHLCKIFASLNNKPIVTFRLFSVYGPYEEPTRLVPSVMKALLKREIIHLASGNLRRDFIHIEDVCDAYLKALKLGTRLKGEICNIGTGKEVTNDEIVEKIFSATKTKTKVSKGTYAKRPWEALHWKANSSHTKKVLNWEPKHTLKTGLLNTYSWFEKNIKLYA